MPPDTEEASSRRYDENWTSQDALVEELARRVRALHLAENRGALARLRRMETTRPREEIFYRILVGLATDPCGASPDRIALALKIIALPMSGDLLNRTDQSIGSVLKAQDVSERRVQVLMVAQGTLLDEHVLRMARRLSRSAPFPYLPLCRLVLCNRAEIEKARFGIARSFWTAVVRAEPSIEPKLAPVPAGDFR